MTFIELRSRPIEIGWFARCQKKDAYVTVTFANELPVSTKRFEIGSEPTPIGLPWPLDGRLISRTTELQLAFDAPDGAPIELLVHRMLDRREFIALARGNGVEIGPGANPKILPSASVSVQYLEEMSIEKWKELYNRTGKYGSIVADWSNYGVGTADNIPARKASLDFIFSNHVFEHLSNPLGHLIRWRELLTPGGVILASCARNEFHKRYVRHAINLDGDRAGTTVGYLAAY